MDSILQRGQTSAAARRGDFGPDEIGDDQRVEAGAPIHAAGAAARDAVDKSGDLGAERVARHDLYGLGGEIIRKAVPSRRESAYSKGAPGKVRDDGPVGF